MGKYKTRCIFNAGKQSLVYAAESGKKPVSYMALSVRFSISEDLSESSYIWQKAVGNGFLHFQALKNSHSAQTATKPQTINHKPETISIPSLFSARAWHQTALKDPLLPEHSRNVRNVCVSQDFLPPLSIRIYNY
jgi:hypothetical protein